MSSNFSLKEQLQALSIGLSSSSAENNNKQNPNSNKQHQAGGSKQKPLWLEQAQYGVELLKAYFPLCFKEAKDIQPLKIGIKQDLAKRLSTLNDIVISDKACMVNSLAYYVNSPSYHKNVVAGAIRVDLDGNPDGVVSAEEASYSMERRKAKFQKKLPSDQTAETSVK